MAEAPLFPTVPTPIQLQGNQRRQLPPAGAHVLRDWEFDFHLNDLTTTPDGRSVEIRRPEHVVGQHCIVNLMIERAAYRIYPRRFGMDYEGAMRLPRLDQLHVDIEQQIRRQLRAIRGVRDTVEPRWLPYPVGIQARGTTFPPPSVYSPATYERMERHNYDELEEVSYAVLEQSFILGAETTSGGAVGGGDPRDQQYLRFVVVMQPGLPRRTLQVAVPVA